jgi:signal transduction histidine kinase
VRNIRSSIFYLRPREFSGNLAEAVSNLANEFQQNSQVATQLVVQGDGVPSLATSLTVYNIAHESLSNIQRHAHASQVSVTLDLGESEGKLLVADNGVGFDANADSGQSHRGLRNMRARARSIEAELELDSSPGSGARLTLRFPLAAPGR